MRVTGAVSCHVWHERTISAMGSPGTVIAGDATEADLDWAEAELARLERCWSRFRHDSELSALNRARGWHDVGPELADAIDRALRLHVVTEGRFDPTVLGCLVDAGYDRSFPEVAVHRADPPPPARPAPGMAGIRRSGSQVWLPLDTALDLGGLGKGLAADLVAEGLVARGARSACVSLGGDIRVAGGSPVDGGWRVPVADPRQGAAPGAVLGTVAVHDGAIVTSTTAVRTWTRGNRRLHHLIDPATGAPADRGVRAVVATAREAWFAEGVAKAALVAGRAAGRELLDRAGVAGWLITDDGAVVASEWAPSLLTEMWRAS